MGLSDKAPRSSSHRRGSIRGMVPSSQNLGHSPVPDRSLRQSLLRIHDLYQGRGRNRNPGRIRVAIQTLQDCNTHGLPRSWDRPPRALFRQIPTYQTPPFTPFTFIFSHFVGQMFTASASFFLGISDSHGTPVWHRPQPYPSKPYSDVT